MALTYQLILLLGLSGLWVGADACKDCCVVCPKGWTAHKSNCYMFVGIKKDWSDAEKGCIARGGNLASFDNDEFKFIRQFVVDESGAATQTWLGGYEKKEGSWCWADGKSFQFNGWHTNQPNNDQGKEDCLEMMDLFGQAFNDAPCDDKKAFLCSRVPGPLIP